MKDNEYVKFDVSTLHTKKTEVISFEKSLNDITPITWSKDVRLGKKKIEVMESYKR